MLITKIKVKHSPKFKILIEWIPKENEPDKIGFIRQIKPPEDFLRSINFLRDSFIEICELNIDLFEANRITIIGLSCNYKKGVMGCVITASVELKKSDTPLIINTPFKKEKLPEGSGSKQKLPPQAIEDIKTVLGYAEKFIKDQNNQLDLFGLNN